MPVGQGVRGEVPAQVTIETAATTGTRSKRVRGAVLVLAACVVLIIEIHFVFIREVGVPSVLWGLQPFVARSPDIADLHLEQTMLVEADGFYRIELWPEPTEPDARGYVSFVLRDITRGNGPIVTRQRVPLGAVLHAASYALEFSSITKSRGRRYRLEISAPGITAKGLGFWAVRGRHYRDGGLSINRQARWANLMFRGSAARTTVFARAASRRQVTDRFPGPTFLLVVWVLAHVALGLLFIVLGNGNWSTGLGSRLSQSQSSHGRV